jgi:hypothetical protein
VKTEAEMAGEPKAAPAKAEAPKSTAAGAADKGGS